MLTKPVYLEIDKPNYVPIYTVQYDYNSRFYEITILNNSQPLDLTGIRVIVAGKKPDGKEVFNSCKVLDAKKGLIQLELTEQMNAVNGASEYALELFSADGMLSSQPFKLIVTRSTISKSVESSKELGALKDALNEVQDIDNRFAQTNAQLSMDKQELSNRIDNIIALPDGSTTADAELVDIRIGNNGLKYSSAGQAIRSQIATLHDSTKCIQHVNLVSEQNVVRGSFLSQTINSDKFNSYVTDAGYVTSPLIEVNEGDTIHLFVVGYSVALYYSSDGVLRGKADLSHNVMQTITVPTNSQHRISYMRVFCQDTTLEKFFISQLKDDISYTNDDIYIKGLLPSDHIVNEMVEQTTDAFINIGISPTYTALTDLHLDDGGVGRDGEWFESSDVKHFTIEVKKGEKYLISGKYAWGHVGFVYRSSKGELTVFPSTSDTMDDYKFEPFEVPLNGTLYVNNVYGTVSDVYLMDKTFHKTNALFQKSAYFDGDSITFGQGGKSFANQIGDKYYMKYVNKGVGGTTLSMQDGRSDSILERVKAIDKPYDFIVIEGGYNDWFQKIPIGTITQNYDDVFDEKTVIGAVESICKHIKTNFDESHFLFVLGHRASNVGKKDESFDEYWNAIESVLNKWSVNYVDIRQNGGLVAYNQTWLTKYFGVGEEMGTHPNELGYKKFYVPYIESKMFEMVLK